jgi:hypothetical protein
MTDDNNIFVLPVPGPGDVLSSSMTYEIATLRDQFAMAALRGMSSDTVNNSSKDLAVFAYEIADAMMEARK